MTYPQALDSAQWLIYNVSVSGTRADTTGMMMTDLQVAQTIKDQLGGHRFAVFTGARDFVGGPDFLQFRIPKAKSGINKVKVILTAMDDYTMEFWKCRGTKWDKIETRESVYCDQLQDIFLDVTGLYTRF